MTCERFTHEQPHPPPRGATACAAAAALLLRGAVLSVREL